MKKILLTGFVAVAAAAVIFLALPSSRSAPDNPGSPTTMRRLNESQYARSIADIFSTDINIPGRFEPPLREEGLLAIGDARVNVTPYGFEQYELRAREIAAQVVSKKNRANYIGCSPEDATTYSDPCAKQVLGKYGRLLYRRSLSDAEMALALTTAQAASKQRKSFYEGVGVALSQLLMSPDFIFRVETTEPDPQRPGHERLDAWSLATRISFLIWDAAPDEALLDAAASGELFDEAVLGDHIDRMLASPRFADGVRSFFSDMFGYEQFAQISKDQSIYPLYNSQLAADAEEQILRTIVHTLVEQNRDYRDLFTTRETFFNRRLGALYRIAVSRGSVDGWAAHTFSADDHRAGLLTLAGFLMLDPTHEGRSSPTNRGKYIRELYLCQEVPLPPPDVDFAIVLDTNNPDFKTARDRLTAHRTNPTCAGCHAITDPLGLAFENFDAIGQYRTHENGALIDTSGNFEQQNYDDALALQKILHGSPDLSSCLTKRVYEYTIGNPAESAHLEWLAHINEQFAKAGYTLPGLIKSVATSKAIRRVAQPHTETGKVAALHNN